MPANSAPANPAEEQREPYPIEIFQRNEDRVFQIGYRLATANAEFCDRTILSPGFLIHDAESYADASGVRTLFGLSGDIGIQSVAPNSTAASAGLKRNDTLVAINGVAVAERWHPTDPGGARIVAIRDELDALFARGQVSTTWAGENGEPRVLTLIGEPSCASRFLLESSSSKPSADGLRVLIGAKYAGLYDDGATLPAAIAHELAHNILGHPQMFRAVGRKRKLVRLSERDADRLSPWLLYNAGYDPSTAVAFMNGWVRAHGGGIFRDRSHDGWDERAENVAAELPKIAAAAEEGKADWRRYFVPELRVSPEHAD